jgi:hypothetical protein
MFQYITANVNKVVRNDTLEGKPHLVGQMVMINEGVHRGSDGPIFYPAEELSKGLVTWNHRPVVVYHPVENGLSVSATSPSQLSSRKIGITLNTKYDKKTKSVKAVDGRVADAVENETMMECSTGLFMTLEKTEGEWNGEEYIGIARNLCLDHLAVLPDKTGACSIEDGAGFLRTNQMVLNEISYDVTQSLLRSALYEKVQDAWMVETFDSYLIYEVSGSYYKQNYSLSKGSVTFDGLPIKVEKKVEYIEVTLNQKTKVINVLDSNEYLKTLESKEAQNIILKTIKKGKVMDKSKTVNELIANDKSPWKEENREELMAMSELALNQLVIANKEPEVKTEPANNQEPDKKIQVTKTPVENQVPKQMTEEEYIQNAPAGLRDTLRSGMLMAKQQRKECIDAIIANESNTFTQEYLDGQPLEVLTALSKFIPKPKVDKVPFYTGPGGNIQNDAKITHQPLGLPSMDELIKNQK